MICANLYTKEFKIKNNNCKNNMKKKFSIFINFLLHMS